MAFYINHSSGSLIENQIHETTEQILHEVQNATGGKKEFHFYKSIKGTVMPLLTFVHTNQCLQVNPSLCLVK